MMMSAGVWD